MVKGMIKVSPRIIPLPIILLPILESPDFGFTREKLRRNWIKLPEKVGGRRVREFEISQPADLIGWPPAADDDQFYSRNQASSGRKPACSK